jgi:PAS domain S-box-containing protein
MVPPEARAILAEPDAAFYSDCGGVLRAWLPWAQQLLGYTSDEALGRRVDFMVPSEYHEQHWRGYDRAIANGVFVNPDGATLPVVAKSGARIPLAFLGRIVRGEDGEVAGIVSLLRAG